MALIRRYRFSSSHLYRRPEWSDEENRRRFGKCSIPPGHGHNYRLVIAVAGEPDDQTGFVIDLARLDALVTEAVIEPLDHRHINEAIADFSPGRAIPSSERLAFWIRDRLFRALPESVSLRWLQLFEDDDLGAEWTPADGVDATRKTPST